MRSEKPNRDIQPQRSLSAHAGSSAAEAAKANQMQRELLRATACLVRPGQREVVVTGGRPLYRSDEPRLLRSIVLTASFRAAVVAAGPAWNCRAALGSLRFPPGLSTPASSGVYRISSHFLQR